VKDNDCYLEFDDDPALEDTHSIYFDIRNRYMACYGDQCVNIINLDSNDLDPITTKFIDPKFISRIVAIQLVSFDQSFRCDVACKAKDSSQIFIFNILKEINQNRVISFNKNSHHGYQVKISRDFRSVAFVHGEENYLLTKDEDGYC